MPAKSPAKAPAKSRTHAAPDARRLNDLRSVGPATLQDFADLGVRDVPHLAEQDPDDLYLRLAELKKAQLKGAKLDLCCRDVFACAIAQAKDPELPREQRDWWWWSKQR